MEICYYTWHNNITINYERSNRHMSTKIIDKCDFCNKNLVEKETLFSVNITKERMIYGIYEADDSESVFLSCESCGKKT